MANLRCDPLCKERPTDLPSAARLSFAKGPVGGVASPRLPLKDMVGATVNETSNMRTSEGRNR